MASLVFTDAFVSIGGVDVSASVQSVTLPYAAEMVDETTMGATTRINKGGLKTWSSDITFKQDFAASPAPDAVLFPLVGTTFTYIVRPVKGTAVSATNPNYTGTGILESYTPIDGSVGDLATAPVTIQSAGTLTRAIV